MTDNLNKEIARDITIAIIQKSSFVLTTNNFNDSATAIADIYQTIYRAVENPKD